MLPKIDLGKSRFRRGCGAGEAGAAFRLKGEELIYLIGYLIGVNNRQERYAISPFASNARYSQAIVAPASAVISETS